MDGPGGKSLRRRELASYVALCLERQTPINLGEAADVLREKFCYSNKTALNIVRRLIKLSLLVKTGEMEYECVSPVEYLRRLAEEYSAWRRRLKDVC
ncbi:MAG: hypothetical protein GU348_05445 [Thermogladius sp.]|jgi:hypothetical protein|uniref:Uncharacterized protein n=1 Tax=Thermogladius calderae TaxID=1200300 RepID=A0A7J3Y0C1_9CREN|nr:hypothetical protein [Thermogladius sp.]